MQEYSAIKPMQKFLHEISIFDRNSIKFWFSQETFKRAFQTDLDIL